MTHRISDHLARYTPGELRARLAHGLLALAGKVHDDGRVDYDSEFSAGYRMGQRAGRREATR